MMMMRLLIKYVISALLLIGASNSYASFTYSTFATATHFATPDLLCESNLTANPGWTYTGWIDTGVSDQFFCQQTRDSDGYVSNSLGFFRFSHLPCPSPFVDDGSGQCVAVSNCVASGVESQVFWEFDVTDATMKNVPSFHSDGSCLFHSLDNSSVSDCGVYTKSDGTLVTGCFVTVLPTDLSGTVTDANNSNTAGMSTTADTSTVSSTSSDNTTVTSKDVVSPPPTVQTLPDGTVVTSGSEVVTSSAGEGTTVTETPPIIKVESSSGSNVVVATDTVTSSMPDGSVEEVIVKDTVSTTPNKNTQYIDNSTNIVTNTNVSGNTTHNQTTIINQYGSDGKLTSSSESSTGDNQPNPNEDPLEEGNCGAPNQPSCEISIDEGDYDYAGELTRISQIEASNQLAQDDFILSIDGNDDFGTGLIPDFNAGSFVNQYLQLPAAGCGGAISTSIFGRPFNFDPCIKLQPLRDVLAWVFFVFTFFIILNISLGRKII